MSTFISSCQNKFLIKMNKFYVTSSLPYMNSKPHIGHALEIVQADVVARWKRMNGFSVFFMTGTDEHGSKIAKIAQEEGATPQAVVERNSALFAELKPLLNLSYDYFIRTSDKDNHWPGAIALWEKMVLAGDLYKGSYSGLYCVGCEAFITKKDLVDGECPFHKTVPESVKEDNYFFKLSKYADQIAEKIKSKEFEIIPAGRAKETLNFIKQGLEDISFSRPADKLPWGIPVPGDSDQTMYVWGDALSSYVGGIGYGRDEKSFVQWWPADLHMLGKDIMRFHVIIWPAMILSAGLPLPKKIFVHGFIDSGGQKMSKSLGNVIDPIEAVDQHGIDAVRYYLLREIPSTGDGDFSWQRFEEVYNGELADNLGNLLSRVLQMAHKYFDGKVPASHNKEMDEARVAWSDLNKHMDELNFQKAILSINKYIASLNVLVDEKKPWELAKEDNKQELQEVIYTLLEGLRLSALMIYSFLPDTANAIYEHLGLDRIDKGALNLEQEIQWGGLVEGQIIKQPSILFPKTLHK